MCPFRKIVFRHFGFPDPRMAGRTPDSEIQRPMLHKIIWQHPLDTVVTFHFERRRVRRLKDRVDLREFSSFLTSIIIVIIIL